MILKSRKGTSWARELYRMVWPAKSYVRMFRYFGKRLQRIKATPHALAVGFATGIFAAFSPALGLHIVMAIILAWTLGGNLIAAALATAFANPLTYPLMIAGEYQVGQLVYGGQGKLSLNFSEIAIRVSHLDFSGMWEPLFRPVLTGSIVLGLLFAFASYSLIFYAAHAYQGARELRKSRRGMIAK